MSQDLKASVSFVGDGITTEFYFGFDYINKQFIKVTVGSDDTLLSYPSDYTINEKEVELVEAPAKGTPIRIYRQTDTSRIIEWTDGTFIKASQMTLENVQQLHLIEEAQDYVIINGMSKYPDGVNFNALGARVINVSDPKDPKDAVTKHYMENVQGGFVSANTALVQEANKQASAAKASQESAKASATQADESERASLASANLAEAWATSTTSPDNIADAESATGKTQSSRSWALFSKAKAQEAATSATNAKTQAETATTQAANAKTSASQSASSASASATSASNAKTSETNAKTSETQAGTYAGNSKTSADAAKASETNAKTSETNAAQSATQAAESAGVFQDFKGATASTDGNGGKVPKPLAGQQNKVLKADGTWGDSITPQSLWKCLHSYPMNYVPSDTSNAGWSKLGFCIIYYTERKINNQPTSYGQLINIPVDKNNEVSQLWIVQPKGTILSRGGNTNQKINDQPFLHVGIDVDTGRLVFPSGAEMWVS